MMFFLASCTKEVASRVLQQLVHRQLSQKTPADQKHVQANIRAIPDVCITAVSHTAVRKFWWLDVQMHSHIATQSQLYMFSLLAFFLAQFPSKPASQHA